MCTRAPVRCSGAGTCSLTAPCARTLPDGRRQTSDHLGIPPLFTCPWMTSTPSATDLGAPGQNVHQRGAEEGSSFFLSVVSSQGPVTIPATVPAHAQSNPKQHLPPP